MAITQHQARVYMSSRESGDKQVTASARAGVSVRTAEPVNDFETLASII